MSSKHRRTRAGKIGPPRKPLSSLQDELKGYYRARLYTARSLQGIVVAVVTVVVFHNPQAWGTGEIATAIYYLGWGTIVAFSLVAYVANGRMAERRGFCKGKYGKSPAELSE